LSEKPKLIGVVPEDLEIRYQIHMYSKNSYRYTTGYRLLYIGCSSLLSDYRAL
jgi:hypothetical protein